MKVMKFKLDNRGKIIIDKKYNVSKFVSKEDVIKLIAKKLKKPISEISKKRQMIKNIFEYKLELFLEKKIINHVKTSIENKTKTGQINYWNQFEEELNVHSNIKRRYNSNTKTFTISLSTKKHIEDVIYLFEYRKSNFNNNIRSKKSFLIEFNKFNYPIEYLKNIPKRFVSFMNDKVVSNTQKYLITKQGMDEMQFIENCLEKLSKIEIQIENQYSYIVKYKK